MLNFRLYLALFSVILFGAGCKEDEDWVQVHFTLRNESRVGLEDLGIRHKGTQRQAGYLGPNGMMAFSSQTVATVEVAHFSLEGRGNPTKSCRRDAAAAR